MGCGSVRVRDRVIHVVTDWMRDTSYRVSGVGVSCAWDLGSPLVALALFLFALLLCLCALVSFSFDCSCWFAPCLGCRSF